MTIFLPVLTSRDFLGSLPGINDLALLRWSGRKPKSRGEGIRYILYPDAPCREYLPTIGEKWSHSRGNVGKYSLHGAFGID